MNNDIVNYLVIKKAIDTSDSKKNSSKNAMLAMWAISSGNPMLAFVLLGRKEKKYVLERDDPKTKS